MKKGSALERKENRTGYAFISPYVLLFTIFTGIPFIFSIVLSFTDMTYLTKMDSMHFVGLKNFIEMFKNKEVMAALGRTGLYSLVYVPLIMVVGFILALLLNKGVYFKNTIRGMVFLPYVSNMVAVAVVFKLLLGTGGPLVTLLGALGVKDPPLLLLSDKFALPTVAAIAVWKGVGLNMITYLGALQNVPAELEEAAQIDGANKLQRIKNVVIPMLSPTTFFLIVSSIITSLQNFTVIQSLTDGGPGQATTVMAISIVRSAFVKYQTGFASAQAMVMFAVVMLITLIQWRGQKKWVNY
ncbi:MAG: sugar ABC transporter permease [Clostridiales bacterium]|nr:sugar ABC transporter permease [Clostridiales bacterium]